MPNRVPRRQRRLNATGSPGESPVVCAVTVWYQTHPGRPRMISGGDRPRGPSIALRTHVAGDRGSNRIISTRCGRHKSSWPSGISKCHGHPLDARFDHALHQRRGDGNSRCVHREVSPVGGLVGQVQPGQKPHCTGVPVRMTDVDAASRTGVRPSGFRTAALDRRLRAHGGSNRIISTRSGPST